MIIKHSESKNKCVVCPSLQMLFQYPSVTLANICYYKDGISVVISLLYFTYNKQNITFHLNKNNRCYHCHLITNQTSVTTFRNNQYTFYTVSFNKWTLQCIFIRFILLYFLKILEGDCLLVIFNIGVAIISVS